MVKTRAEKKRKVSDDGSAVVSVKADADDDGAATVVAPPDVSNLSPIQKLLRVDLLKDDSNAVEEALTQLANMCVNSEENRATIHRLGGTAILPGILQKWYGFSDIQAEGCRALSNASIDAAFRKSVKEPGGLDVIIWAMKSYPDNLEVQTYGCGALMNVVCEVSDNAKHVVNPLNGIDCIIAAMNKFAEDAELQRYACGALDLLTEWDEFKEPVKQAGGRRALFDAIENHQDESKDHVDQLQISANRALKALLKRRKVSSRAFACPSFLLGGM